MMPAQSEFSERLEEGKASYFDGRYQESLDVLEAIAPDLTEVALRSDCYMFIGLGHFALGDASAADQAFESSIRANPDLVPQEDLLAADAFAAFEAKRNSMVGRIDVKTSPAGATATIGDRVVGTTPYVGNALVGEHLVKVQLEDYHRYESRVDVEANETAEVQVTMRMTPQALERAREEADLAAGGGPKGTKKTAYIILGGAAAGGVAAAVLAGGSSRESGATVTRTFTNTATPFVPAGPFIADVGPTGGTMTVDITWDNPEAAMFAEVRLITAVHTTIFEQAPTSETRNQFSLPVEANTIYQVLFRNFSQVSSPFMLVLTFPG